MTTLRVEVTQDDIERGRPTALRCPLARAIRRATPVRPVAVFGRADGYDCGDKHYPLPQDAELFVSLFDAGRRSFPGSWVFDIEGPA